jgi:hypothetical protein
MYLISFFSLSQVEEDEEENREYCSKKEIDYEIIIGRGIWRHSCVPGGGGVIIDTGFREMVWEAGKFPYLDRI